MKTLKDINCWDAFRGFKNGGRKQQTGDDLLKVNHIRNEAIKWIKELRRALTLPFDELRTWCENNLPEESMYWGFSDPALRDQLSGMAYGIQVICNISQKDLEGN